MLGEIVYDGELSGTAWMILFVTLLVIVGGLSWCFYRAIRAASEGVGIPQLPDDGEESTQD